jgi:hypothetical protein
MKCDAYLFGIIVISSRNRNYDSNNEIIRLTMKM